MVDRVVQTSTRALGRKTNRIIMFEFKHTSDVHRTILLRHEINKEATCTHLGGSERSDRAEGMGGGNSTSSRRTAFGQGKSMTRGHEDVWDKHRGWKKNHLQTR